jgi:transcription termination/antitermination protein NusG
MSTGLEPRWYALCTKHQHEPTVNRLLVGKGFEIFYPTYHVVHHWKDRNKTLELPLFPGYLFFQEGLDRRFEILSTPGVYTIVSFGDTPAEIAFSEIENIRRALHSSMALEPHPYLSEGDYVRVVRGPLAGVHGILQRKKDVHRLVISMELLGRSAAVEIDAASVERVSLSQRHLGYHTWTERAFNLSN